VVPTFIDITVDESAEAEVGKDRHVPAAIAARVQATGRFADRDIGEPGRTPAYLPLKEHDPPAGKRLDCRPDTPEARSS
jgi:hypothetical protein